MFEPGQILFHEPDMSALMYVDSNTLLFGERTIEGTEEGMLGIIKGFDICVNETETSPANFGELCGMVAGIKMYELNAEVIDWLNLNNKSFLKLSNWYVDVNREIRRLGLGVETYTKILEYSDAYFNFRQIELINVKLL